MSIRKQPPQDEPEHPPEIQAFIDWQARSRMGNYWEGWWPPGQSEPRRAGRDKVDRPTGGFRGSTAGHELDQPSSSRGEPTARRAGQRRGAVLLGAIALVVAVGYLLAQDPSVPIRLATDPGAPTASALPGSPSPTVTPSVTAIP